MPLNEAAGRYRRGLTKEQKKDQLAAIYGLSGARMTPQFSTEEIERMRQMVAAADANNQPNRGMKEFDLNNPPKLPYRHQEFPLMVYNHKRRASAVVASEAQEKAHAKKGFVREPFPSEVLPVDNAIDMSEDGQAE